MQHANRVNSARVLPSLRGLRAERTAAGLWFGVVGEGPDLLLLAGFGADHSAWTPFVPLLRRHFRLLLVDLPGVGNGPPLDPRPDIRQLSDPLEGVLDRLGTRKTSVLGASFGGMVAMRFARDHPERVSRLVLAGSMARLEGDRPDALRERVRLLRRGGASAFAHRMVHDLLDPGFVAAHPRLVGAVVHAYALRLPPADALESLAELAIAADLRPQLGEIPAPTLVLHGDRDRLVPLAEARTLAAGLPSARLQVFAGAGHHLLLERRTEALRAVKSFLAPRPEAKKLPGAPGSPRP
jgi:pimeloyl-ACP methyl ester carboxylesterase